MPSRPKLACACPGCPSCGCRCPELTTGGRCPACAQIAERSFHDADRKKVYNSARWKALRRRKLRANPFCEHPGCLALATDVDHDIALQDGGDPYPPLDKLNALCHLHHSSKTLSEIRNRTH